MHALLRYLLQKLGGANRAALQVALKCVSQQQFADSLEWLLYEAVLEPFETSAANKALFRGSLAYSSVDEDADELNGVSSSASGGNDYTSRSASLFPRFIRL